MGFHVSKHTIRIDANWKQSSQDPDCQSSEETYLRCRGESRFRYMRTVWLVYPMGAKYIQTKSCFDPLGRTDFFN